MALPRRFYYHHQITWTIKNFDFRLKDRKSTITSSEFDIRCLDVSTWSFDLYPTGETKKDCMQFAVCLHYSKSNLPDPYILSVNFAIDLIDANGAKNFHSEGKFSPTSEQPRSWPLDFIPLGNFQEDIHLKSGSFVVVCELTTTVNQLEFYTYIHSEPTTSLSSCTTGMLDKYFRSDMVATSNGVPFDVHECIMRARCPAIFTNPREILFDEEGKLVWLCKFSTKALKILIDYLYGRHDIPVTESLRTELMSIALRYKLEDLERKLREYPDVLELITEIIVEKISFKYPLTTSMWLKKREDYPRQGLHFLPTNNVNVSDLVVSCSVEGTDRLNRFKIGFSFPNFNEEEPVILRCTLYLLNADGCVLKSKGYCHTFSVDEKWSIYPNFLTKRIYDAMQPDALKCDVLITQATYEHYGAPKVCKVEPGGCVLLINPFLLSRDLQSMYENQIKCDMKITSGEYEFLCHSSFLVQRSEMVRRELPAAEEKAAGKVDMPTLRVSSIPAPTLAAIMNYMYSGIIDMSDTSEAEELGKAAALFSLPELLRSSFFFTG